MNRLFTFNRAIAVRLAPLLAAAGFTPNAVTLLSLASGVTGASFFSRGSRKELLLGALFLHLFYVLDNCDGAVARIRSMQSEFGRWFDYVSDLLVELCLWTGLAVATHARGFEWAFAAAGIAAAGSIANFLRVVRMRGAPASSGRRHAFSETMKVLGDDGDPSLLAWALAAAGYPGWFLAAGALYVNFLWIYPGLESLGRAKASR